MEDQRSEPRVAHQIRFFVHVHDCPDSPDLVGTSVACDAIDFSKHGMQFCTDQAIPAGSLLNITIGMGEPSAMYLLRGEIRWVRPAGEQQYMGILLQEAENTDYDTWINDFEATFER